MHRSRTLTTLILLGFALFIIFWMLPSSSQDSLAQSLTTNLEAQFPSVSRQLYTQQLATELIQKGDTLRLLQYLRAVSLYNRGPSVYGHFHRGEIGTIFTNGAAFHVPYLPRHRYGDINFTRREAPFDISPGGPDFPPTVIPGGHGYPVK